MKVKYKQRLYIYFVGIFVLFAGAIIVLSLNKKNKLKIEILQSEQALYAQIVYNYIVNNQLNPEYLNGLSELTSLFPVDLHLTVLNEECAVLFENKLSPDKRDELFHYTHRGKYIIRTSLPYHSVRFYLQKPDPILIVLVTALLFFSLALFFMVNKNQNESLKNLKYFISYFLNNKRFPANISFADEDFNEIQSMVSEIYNRLNRHEKTIAVERKKLIEHFHHAEEGVSFFTPQFQNIYTNSHFIQQLNLLLNVTTFDPTVLFKSEIFREIVRFLENPGDKNTFESKLAANGHTFFVQAIIFEDKSFEIIIRQATETEQNTFDLAEVTNNIAHELLTPVTSVRGYLETLIEFEDLPSEKKQDFLQRAYRQIIRLTDIIQDTVLLSKANNSPQYFHIEEVNILDLLREMIETEIKESIEKNGTTINLLVDKNTTVKGNRTLIHSIFRNLGDNAVKYAGENKTITIHQYSEDRDFYYFSFADNGAGIEDKQLDRIFERFYRINEGRTRDKGGSGLGLPIVKDAVAFHHGEIHVRNLTGGGLEFLFTLRKY
jgi:two-component system OmpR family sensor kinase/two-component system phosphate regulon sensor histidine kinase PhoR